MALKQLGSTYLVANDSGGSVVNDTETAYRGWKDFLLWVDVPVVPGRQVNVTVTNADDQGNSHGLKASLYQCDNLLDDPGSNPESGSVVLPD